LLQRLKGITDRNQRRPQAWTARSSKHLTNDRTYCASVESRPDKFVTIKARAPKGEKELARLD
jgi:hypothetical protein